MRKRKGENDGGRVLRRRVFGGRERVRGKE